MRGARHLLRDVVILHDQSPETGERGELPDVRHPGTADAALWIGRPKPSPFPSLPLCPVLEGMNRKE